MSRANQDVCSECRDTGARGDEFCDCPAGALLALKLARQGKGKPA